MLYILLHSLVGPLNTISLTISTMMREPDGKPLGYGATGLWGKHTGLWGKHGPVGLSSVEDRVADERNRVALPLLHVPPLAPYGGVCVGEHLIASRPEPHLTEQERQRQGSAGVSW